MFLYLDKITYTTAEDQGFSQEAVSHCGQWSPVSAVCCCLSGIENAWYHWLCEFRVSRPWFIPLLYYESQNTGSRPLGLSLSLGCCKCILLQVAVLSAEAAGAFCKWLALCVRAALNIVIGSYNFQSVELTLYCQTLCQKGRTALVYLV